VASDRWRVNRDAIERRLHDLGARARRIPFVTLVEHLERLVVGSVPVGARGPVADEIVRFSHDPSLVFHSSDIASMRVEGTRVALTTTFLGATGAVSPLASFFTEDVLHADSQDQNILAAFYDVFHHRLLSLLYRALQRTRPSWGSGVGGGALQGRVLAAVGLTTPRKDTPLASLAMLGRARGE
jgi:type VI secretion system protein ImpH